MKKYCMETIQDSLTTEWIGQNLHFMEEVDSTNTCAKKYISHTKADGDLFLADRQCCGRGSHGRVWQSPAGTGIWMTIALKPEIPIEKIYGITMIMAYSVVTVLNRQYHIPAQIKWPNDIVLHGHKIAGILTETVMGGQKEIYAVVGIGINVNQRKFPEEIRDTAGSLLLEMGQSYDRIDLINQILMQFEKDYSTYKKDKTMRTIRLQYDRFLAHYQREILVIKGQKQQKALSYGITEEGFLIIQDSLGKRWHLKAGEISIRGLNGYIGDNPICHRANA